MSPREHTCFQHKREEENKAQKTWNDHKKNPQDALFSPTSSLHSACVPNDVAVCFRGNKNARSCHPDVDPSESAATEYAQLKVAYECLRDAKKREAYDGRGTRVLEAR